MAIELVGPVGCCVYLTVGARQYALAGLQRVRQLPLDQASALLMLRDGPMTTRELTDALGVGRIQITRVLLERSQEQRLVRGLTRGNETRWEPTARGEEMLLRAQEVMT